MKFNLLEMSEYKTKGKKNNEIGLIKTAKIKIWTNFLIEFNFKQIKYTIEIIKGHPINECNIKNLVGINLTKISGNKFGKNL